MAAVGLASIVAAYIEVGNQDPAACPTLGSQLDVLRAIPTSPFVLLTGNTKSRQLISGSTGCLDKPIAFMHQYSSFESTTPLHKKYFCEVVVEN